MCEQPFSVIVMTSERLIASRVSFHSKCIPFHVVQLSSSADTVMTYELLR
jgi:hypothetical protein